MNQHQHPAAAPAGEFVRVEVVARWLGISRKRVYQLIAERHLKAARFGPRQTRILRSSVEEFIADSFVEANECEGAYDRGED